MLARCLHWVFRVLRVNPHFADTARFHNATGTPALGLAAVDTEIRMDDGSSDQPQETTVASEALQAITRRNLHEALEQFLKAHYGAGILTDFAIVAETVEPNLDNEVDEHMLWLATSHGLSTWRLIGLSAALSKIAYASVLS